MKNSAGKIIAIVFIILIGLAGIGLVTLRIMFPPEKIKALIVDQVETVLGREVEVGKAGVTIYPSIGFSLSNVGIANTDRPGYSRDAFLHFEKLNIEISVASLFRKEPEIRKIILKKPKILIEVDSSGSFNFSDLAVMKTDSTTVKKTEKKGMPVLPVPISLSLFRIEDGHIEYHDARSEQDIIIGDLDDRIEFSIDKELRDITTRGELSCTQVSLKTKDITRPLSDISVTLHHDLGANLIDGTAEIKSLQVSLQKVVLKMAGSISGLNQTPVMDLTLKSETISLQDVMKEIPVELVPVIAKMHAAGDLTLGLKINGSFEKGSPLPVDGTVSIRNGMFKHNDLPKAVQQIALNCSFTDNSLDVQSLKLRFGDNPVAMKAKVQNFKKPVVDFKMLANMNLGEVKDFAALPPGFECSGKVTVDIAAQGEADPADPTKIAVRGNLKLDNASFLTPPLTKPAVLNGSFVLSSQAIAHQLSVAIGKSSMKMDANVKNYLSFVFPDSTRKLPRPSVTIKVTSPLVDADEFLPPKKEEEKKAAEKKEKAGMAIAPLPGVDVRGSVTAKKVIFNKIPMSNVLVRLSVLNDIVNLTMSSGFARGTISENLYADMQNVKNVRFTNRLSINSVEIGDMLSNFGGFLSKESALNRELNNLPKSLYGKISLNSSFKAEGGTTDAFVENLTGDIAFKMADGTISNSIIVNRLSGVIEKFVKVGDIKFRNLNGKLKVENKSVLVDELKLSSDVGDWNVDGKVGFDAALNLMLGNRLTRSHSGKLLRVQNKGKNLLKGLAGSSKYAGVAGSLIDNTGIPADKAGRVTVLMSLGGTVCEPNASFAGFGEGTVNGGKQATSPKKQVVKAVKEKINNAKLEAQKKLEAERKKAEAIAKQKTAEQKRLAEQKVAEQKRIAEQKKQELLKKEKSATQSIKKNAAKKLKKLF